VSHAIYWIVGVAGVGALVLFLLAFCLEPLTRKKDLGPSSPTMEELKARAASYQPIPQAPERCEDCGRRFIEGVRKRTIEVNRATGKISYLCEDCLKRREVPR
jgi:hypothetical protein